MTSQRSSRMPASRCAIGAAGLALLAACGATHASSTYAGSRYASKTFVVPLTVTVDPALEPEPAADNPNLLFWNAKRSADNKIRFFVPVEVYRPHSTVPESPPKDFLNFIRGQAAAGATFSNVVTLTVDGHPATVMTTTTAVGLEGSLGCPVKGAQQSEECFGFQPDYVLRLAVMDVDGKPFLAWARTLVAAPDNALLTAFDTMLTTIKFRS